MEFDLNEWFKNKLTSMCQRFGFKLFSNIWGENLVKIDESSSNKNEWHPRLSNWHRLNHTNESDETKDATFLIDKS